MNRQQELDLEEFFDSPYYDAAHAFLKKVTKTIEEKLVKAKPEDPQLALKSAAHKGAIALLFEFEQEKYRQRAKRAR